MKSQFVLGVATLLLLAIIILMSLLDWTGEGTGNSNAQQEAPAITSEGVSARAFDQQGQLQYSLTAASSAEFDHEQRLELVQPHIEMFSGGQHWTIEADHGEMYGKNRHLTLTRGVTAHLDGPDPVELQTQQLDYWPKTEKLESPGQLTIRHQHDITRADHMEAQIGQGILTLTGHVESTYAVPAS